MSDEDFEAMLNKYYDRSTDSLRMKGHSHRKRPFISEGCGYPPDVSRPSYKATLQRCRGQWPPPNMRDADNTIHLLDGEYQTGPVFKLPAGYEATKEAPSDTFILHTSNVFTNVQVIAC